MSAADIVITNVIGVTLGAHTTPGFGPMPLSQLRGHEEKLELVQTVTTAKASSLRSPPGWLLETKQSFIYLGELAKSPRLLP